MNGKWPSEEIMQQRRKDLSSARQRWQKHWAWVWQQKQSQGQQEATGGQDESKGVVAGSEQEPRP